MVEDAKVILSQEELQKLKDMQSELNQITMNLGSIEIQVKDLTNLKEQLLLSLDVLRKNQNQYGEFLNKKYGNGTIDLDTGEFTVNK